MLLLFPTTHRVQLTKIDRIVIISNSEIDEDYSTTSSKNSETAGMMNKIMNNITPLIKKLTKDNELLSKKLTKDNEIISDQNKKLLKQFEDLKSILSSTGLFKIVENEKIE